MSTSKTSFYKWWVKNNLLSIDVNRKNILFISIETNFFVRSRIENLINILKCPFIYFSENRGTFQFVPQTVKKNYVDFLPLQYRETTIVHVIII